LKIWTQAKALSTIVTCVNNNIWNFYFDVNNKMKKKIPH
jgi:hypothetical protein